MVRKSGQRGVPVIDIDGQIIIGFDRPKLQSIIASRAGRPSLGAKVADARTIAAKNPNVPALDGAYVGVIHPGTAAERAGLRTGDIIVSFGGRPIRSAADLAAALATIPHGRHVSARIFRQGEIIDLSITI